MVEGIPFPDVYDWTWGEVIEHINCRAEARKEQLRTSAMMLFRHASLVGKMMTAQKGQRFSVMEEFDMLWTDEERMQAKADALRKKLMDRTK